MAVFHPAKGVAIDSAPAIGFRNKTYHTISDLWCSDPRSAGCLSMDSGEIEVGETITVRIEYISVVINMGCRLQSVLRSADCHQMRRERRVVLLPPFKR